MNSEIFYWANDVDKNSGEGILARQFLILIRKKYPRFKLININKLKKRKSIFYKYISPFLGLIYLHIYNLKGYKTSYVNYLPIWNFILILFLPKQTLLGPITGSETKKNKFYILLKKLGILVLKLKYKSLLFSHNQFHKYFKKNKSNFYDFLLYNFKFNHRHKKKKFDITVYLRKHSNKGNEFLSKLVNNLSISYKISIL